MKPQKKPTLSETHPELAAQWHYDKNSDLTPEQFTAGSGKKVWWICKNGHEWAALIGNRAKGIGCPGCSGRMVTSKNNLAILYPDLANQWHPEKNGDLKPEQFTPGSGKKVWWLCERGHEWNAVIGTRSKGVGCPGCASKIATEENNLAVLYSEIATQWHPEKNGDLKPEDVTFGSSKKVWWLCKKGHEWETVIEKRTRRGQGCPWCSGRMVTQDNSLAILYHEIAAQWHPEKNGDLTPEQVTPGSHKKVWWRCEKGHEWQAIISNRAKGRGCPGCSGKRAVPGKNLAVLYSKIAAQWHPTKNGSLTPEQVTPGSHKKVWWLCEKGHEWQYIVGYRTKGN
ncbi:zinc-ribbon domain-containing protein, partial [Candidatus Riflebacteria bacterium]